MYPEIFTFAQPIITGHRKLYPAISTTKLIIYYGAIAKYASNDLAKHQSHEMAKYHGSKFELKTITIIS